MYAAAKTNADERPLPIPQPPALRIQTNGAMSTLALGLGVSRRRSGPDAQRDLDRSSGPVPYQGDRHLVAGTVRVDGALERDGRGDLLPVEGDDEIASGRLALAVDERRACSSLQTRIVGRGSGKN